MSVADFIHMLVKICLKLPVHFFPHVVTEHANHAKDNLLEIHLEKYDG